MLDALPDAARLWLFPLDRTLAPAAADALRDAVAAWLPSWASHGRPVTASVEVVEGRVLAVGAVISEAEANAGVSGCGIDAMERTVAEALAAHAIGLAPALGVLVRDGDAWESVARPALRRRLRAGEADAATLILDVTPATVGEARAEGLARPLGETWAARAFGLGRVGA